MTDRKPHFETLAVHGGAFRADPVTGSVAVPIHQTTSYQFQDTAHAERLFALQELGHIYTRVTNPTVEVLEQRLAVLEGGAAAVAVASGQAASFYSVLNLAQAGDNIVTSTDLYGGTWNLFANTLKQIGIEARFVDPADPENFRRATDDRTRAYYAETLPNPKLNVFPIREVADIGLELGVPLIVDNTAAPLTVRPFDHGAAVTIYSATKYIGGHGTSIGGVIIDSGKFKWNNGKFPEFTEPDPSYHGLVYWDALGNVPGMGNVAFILKIRVTLLRDMGAAVSPFNSWLFIQGLETLFLRQRQHSANALEVAKFLQNHPLVTWITYPGLPNDPNYANAAKYFKHGFGGLIGFGIKGGAAAGAKFINSVKLLSHLANIGDAKSLVIHPASTTHQQLTPEEQAATGVKPDYIRLSIGLEDVADIKADIEQALQASQA